jgi:6-phosphogluconolactonase
LAHTKRLLLTLVWLVGACWAVEPTAADYWIYFGTYTPKSGLSQSKGIYMSRYESAKGDISQPELVAETDNPSYLALHPNHRVLYTVNETASHSTVSSYAIEAGTGKLTLLNRVPSGGQSPCAISLDKAGHYLLVANFTGGSFGVLRLQADGSIGEETDLIQQTGSGPNKQWQAGSRAHWAGFSPDGRFILVMNLGTDSVYLYRFDPEHGKATPTEQGVVKLQAGYGPRNIAFDATGRFVYLVNQLGGALIVYRWDADHGALTPIQETTLKPPGFTEEFNGGEDLFDRSGQHLYVANRGSDTLAVFSVDAAKGTVALLQQESSRGMSPRHIAFDPTGQYLLVANQYTDNLIFLGVDSATGRLRRTRTFIKLNSISYIQFVPIH